MFGDMHESYVKVRRARILAGHIAELVPADASILDVGCGDGAVATALIARRPDVRVEGVEVMVRQEAPFPVRQFDGEALPFANESFDVVLFSDVLHHARAPLSLLREGARVALDSVLLKDHLHTGLLAGPTLRFMDWAGNARHGVALRSAYWSPEEWRQMFDSAGLALVERRERLGLYPWPASLLFERGLHFVASLRPVARQQKTTAARPPVSDAGG